jgi:hypothetical protein
VSLVREQVEKKLASPRAEDGRSCNALTEICPTSTEIVSDLGALLPGLVIVEAVYGVLDEREGGGDRDQGAAETQTIDVRIPLQSLVTNDTLVVPSGRTKARLLGFWDPALGSRKQLRVRYTFKRRMHQVVVDDKSPLSMPLQGEFSGPYRLVSAFLTTGLPVAHLVN